MVIKKYTKTPPECTPHMPPRTLRVGYHTLVSNKLSGRVLQIKVPLGHIKIRGVIALRGNCPTNRGNCPRGNCPTGIMVLGGSCPGG